MGRGDALHLGPDGPHAVRKLLRLRVVGQLALHPDGVTIRCVCDRTSHGAVASAAETVVPFPGTRCVPVKVDVLPTKDDLGDGAGLGVGLALGFTTVPFNQGLAVRT